MTQRRTGKLSTRKALRSPAEVVKDYQRLGTLDALGEHYGVTRERARQILNNAESALGIEYEHPRAKVGRRMRVLIDVMKNPQTMAQVVAATGFTASAIRKVCSNLGIDPPADPAEADTLELIDQLYDVLFRQLGHHPSWTEICHPQNGSLRGLIARNYGGIGEYREAKHILYQREARPAKVLTSDIKALIDATYERAVQSLGKHPSALDLSRSSDPEIRALNYKLRCFYGGLPAYRHLKHIGQIGPDGRDSNGR